MPPPPLSSSTTFLSLRKERSCSLAVAPHSVLPQPLATNNLLSVSMDLPILDISYKWNNTVYDLWCLVYFTQHNVFKVDPHCSFYQYIIFLLCFVLIYLFFAVLGLRFCVRASSSCGKWGPLFFAVRGPLTIAASLVAEHRLQTRRLSNCGSRA